MVFFLRRFFIAYLLKYLMESGDNMYCRKCGQEIPNDSKFCPVCGEYLGEGYKRVTFKDGTMALFNKLFVFEGKSSRSEFNYGLLFLMLASMVMSLLVMGSDINTLSDPNSMQSIEEMMNMFASKDILNSYNLYNIGVSLLYVIFLSAPVYRRLADIGFDSKRTKIMTIAFVASQILCSSLVWCLIPTDIYNAISIVLDIVSIINLAIILMCVFRRGYFVK